MKNILLTLMLLSPLAFADSFNFKDYSGDYSVVIKDYFADYSVVIKDYYGDHNVCVPSGSSEEEIKEYVAAAITVYVANLEDE